MVPEGTYYMPEQPPTIIAGNKKRMARTQTTACVFVIEPPVTSDHSLHCMYNHPMAKTYPYGYATPPQQLTITQLESKWTWRTLHPEMRRRLIALFDAAQDAGKVLGVGEAARSSAQQTTVFLQRHDVVASGGCCGYNGKRYALKKGLAHAAPPGRSWHEDGSYETFAMAADLVGDLPWMKSQAAKFGLIEFSEVNSEPWHVQCSEFPKARSQYKGEKLSVWPLPREPKPVPVVDVPTPTLRLGSTGQEVIDLQNACKFWGWYTFNADGNFGPRTDAAVRRMQVALKITADGVYGPKTAEAYRQFVISLMAI